VPRRPLATVGWAHAVAAVIEDAARQQGGGVRPGGRRPFRLDELSLNFLEQVTIEDRLMFCGTDLALEQDLADVEPVAQEIGERADGMELVYRVVFGPTFEATDSTLAGAVQHHIEQLKMSVKVHDLKHFDSEQLRKASEELVVILQSGAPKIGLKKPTTEETAE
jgi:hypothetical protein